MKHYAKRTVQIITAAMMMLAAPAMAWGEEEVKYISGDEEKSIEATVLTSEETTLGTDGAETWYVVPEGGVAYDQGLILIGDVYLILRDGATMDVPSSLLNGEGSINIFAQSTGENMGQLVITAATAGGNITINGGQVEVYDGGISAQKDITINGGQVTVSYGIVAHKDITINGGQVTVSDGISALNDITINGGQVTVNGGGIFPQKNITLSWSKVTDFIQASSIQSESGTISIRQGKKMAYIDEDNDNVVTLEGMVKLFDTGKTNLWMTWYDQGVWVMPEGCTAYKVSGISTDGKSVMIEPIENGEVPGYTPVLIKREYQDRSYYATFSEIGEQPSSSNEDDSKGWVFKGNYYTNSMGGLYGIDAHADKVSYILLNDEFVRVYASDGEIQPRRCWLTVTPAATNTAGARRLSIGSANSSGGTTAIRTMDGDSSDAASDALWHTLDGRTLTTRPTQKGIYIHQGNKIIIK